MEFTAFQKKIAELLNVNFNSLKKYDYKNPEDLIYLFFWLEEYIPNYRLDLSQIKNINDSKIKVLINSLLEWKKQKIKRDKSFFIKYIFHKKERYYLYIISLILY